MTKLIRIKGLDIVFIRYLQLKRAKPKKENKKVKANTQFPLF